MLVIVLLGVIAGPTLNLLIDRLPARLPLLAAPTCPTCRQRRPRSSLLPLTGWWLGTARCPTCKATVERRVLLVNLGLPLVGAALWLRDAGQPIAYLHLTLAAYFIAIVAIDLEHRLVLNRMTFAGLAAAGILSIVGLGPTIESTLIGTGVGFLFLWIPAVLMPGLGMGDVKLAAVIGALVGFPAVLTALTLGVIVGGFAAGLLMLTRQIGRRGTIAYAPYLVIGVSLVLFGLMG